MKKTVNNTNKKNSTKKIGKKMLNVYNNSNNEHEVLCEKIINDLHAVFLRETQLLLFHQTFEALKKLNKCIYFRSTGNFSTFRKTCNQHNATTTAVIYACDDDDDDVLQTHSYNDDDRNEIQCILYLNDIDRESEGDISLNTTDVPTATSTANGTTTVLRQRAKHFPQKNLSTTENIIKTIQQQQSRISINNSSTSSLLKHSHSVSGDNPVIVLRAPPKTSNTSRRSISPSRRSAISNSSSTAKHEQLSQAATTAAASIATSVTSITPLEKEKKRKEISSSRVKKFHRHFSQVSKDEKLINYFSCALVSDILLQGHLYITDKHFAFYSNVFGYVTKVVIPTSSVTKISKEKTAKIIPNAVGVATAAERHVFGSFISREAAYRLMCSVCPNPLAPIELISKDLTNIEISEEYSIEDDSSCSVSGNDSPTQITENSSNTNISDKITTTTSKAVHIDTSQTLLRRNVGNNNSNLSINGNTSKQRHSDIPYNAKISASSNDIRSSAPATTNVHFFQTNISPIRSSSNSNNNNYKSDRNSFSQTTCSSKIITNASALNCSTSQNNVKLMARTLSKNTSVPSPTTSTTVSSPITITIKSDNKSQRLFKMFRCCANNLLLPIKYPTELHVVYIGVFLTLLLTVFTTFLLFRILDVEAKTSLYHQSPLEFNWHSGNDDDIFFEALRLQRELQHKSNKEVESILKTNLEQIAKVRRSLETLSTLINERRSSFDYTQPVKQKDETAK